MTLKTLPVGVMIQRLCWQHLVSMTSRTDDSSKTGSSFAWILAPVTLTPEVPGVGQELPPALGVLGGSDVAGCDLLTRGDLEPRLDLHSPVLRIVLADGVTPAVDIVHVLSYKRVCLKLFLHARVVEESLHGIH